MKKQMVPARLELATVALLVLHSIQLSYGTITIYYDGLIFKSFWQCYFFKRIEAVVAFIDVVKHSVTTHGNGEQKCCGYDWQWLI